MAKWIVEKGKEKDAIIPMFDMKPGEVAEVFDIGSYNGTIVLRTWGGDDEDFQVMNITDVGVDKWWNKGCTLKVRLLTEPITLTISNE